MSTPRRRLVRPSIAAVVSDVQRQRQLQKLRARLEHERTALGRWQSRLRRAFNTFEKIHKRIARIERQLARWEE
jgi:septal ring factor EnvC (AmiA/AmiB activator)